MLYVLFNLLIEVQCSDSVTSHITYSTCLFRFWWELAL